MNSCGDQAGDVRHVDHQSRIHLVCDAPETLEIDDSRIGTGSGDDQ